MSKSVVDRLRSEAEIAGRPGQRDRLLALAHELAALLADLDAARRELAEARRLNSVCTCYDGNPQNYEGPHADCPIHGAIQAFNEASADLSAALEQRDYARAQLAAVEAERDRFVRAGQDAIKDLDAAREALRRVEQELEATKLDRDRADECRHDFARMAMENVEKVERMRPVVEAARAWYANGVDPEGRFTQALWEAIETYEQHVERWTGVA